ncbi:MAG: biotin synthase BioB, partial [Opitutales bacterium]
MKYKEQEIEEIYNLPFTTLIFRAQETHHRHQDPAGIQACALKSIKTGSCPEDCKYCPQSAHYNTFVGPQKLLDTETILEDARRATREGASRFCMGAAWKQVPDGSQFESVLETISAVRDLGLEVCCTLGSMTKEQAVRLKDAGCTIYNHNLDTSRDYYEEIITTRTYDERLETLRNARAAELEICSGGILGMGESVRDRLEMLRELANLEPQPESVPINALIAVEGTPLAEKEFVDGIEFVRVIATARILMPKAMVRLSAGRTEMSEELQTLCFLAGANSIFLGERLLTTENPDANQDLALLEKLGLKLLDPEKARAIHQIGRAH